MNNIILPMEEETSILLNGSFNEKNIFTYIIYLYLF